MNGHLIMTMPLTEGEGLFVYIFPRSEEDDPDAWNYGCDVNSLHERFIKDEVYQKQKLIDQDDVQQLYSLLHLGLSSSIY